jgi:uncharacterized protein (DUF1810 family)
MKHMANTEDLQRFLRAQEGDYATALSEIKAGRKRSHWMWYIFPQISGLGFSSTSVYYGIKSLDEAAAYLQHSILGKRLLEISEVLLSLEGQNATAIFGQPDDSKLKSCMTLFSRVPGSPAIFQQVLDRFFYGLADERTIQLLAEPGSGLFE